MTEESDANGPSMRAVIVRQPGGVEQLEVARIKAPALAPGCIEIDVHASALNRADLLQRRGLYAPPPGASEILGLECAGVVRAVADGVKGVAKGDHVMALLAGGGYAERVVVPASLAMSIPAGLTFEQAAAIPEAFLTASEALFTLGQLAPGNSVLIHAAAGGVGSAAVQLAKLAGAQVIASVGTAEKRAWVEQLGADAVVNYRETDFVEACQRHTGARGVNVVLDCVGGTHMERHQRCLAEEGRWIVLGMLGGTQGALDLGVILRRRLQICGLVMRSRTLADKSAIVERFSRRFLPHFATGELQPRIDRCYPMSEVRAAHERMEKNENIGKIVLVVAAALDSEAARA